jgi:hypothetical protein
MCPQYLFDARCSTIPIRSQIIFGGAPRRVLKSLKSLSLVTIVYPLARANVQTVQVTRLIKPMKDNMAAFGKQIGDPCHQFARQVVITAFLTEVEPG